MKLERKELFMIQVLKATFSFVSGEYCGTSEQNKITFNMYHTIFFLNCYLKKNSAYGFELPTYSHPFVSDI